MSGENRSFFAPGAHGPGARYFGKMHNFSYFFSQIFVQIDEDFFPENP